MFRGVKIIILIGISFETHYPLDDFSQKIMGKAVRHSSHVPGFKFRPTPSTKIA
jgi:hypothetical protein